MVIPITVVPAPIIEEISFKVLPIPIPDVVIPIINDVVIPRSPFEAVVIPIKVVLVTALVLIPERT